ncbi:hypothetical protein FHS23_001462 [Prauserella isguenensis]|uniref:Uncharacterized protein n=1 Tax=Prauserella isguenensis TaxID=1470180 RepID=A0A839S153_9PSEU|nr:hypothetical protein [Prauserella isguenensis]MBB3050467.1 hypothetical protein [Prauserella isguenensis]
MTSHAKTEGGDVVEPATETQDDWVAIAEETVNQNFYATTDPWYRGSNVSGKPTTFLDHLSGVGKHRHAVVGELDDAALSHQQVHRPNRDL